MLIAHQGMLTHRFVLQRATVSTAILHLLFAVAMVSDKGSIVWSWWWLWSDFWTLIYFCSEVELEAGFFTSDPQLWITFGLLLLALGIDHCSGSGHKRKSLRAGDKQVKACFNVLSGWLLSSTQLDMSTDFCVPPCCAAKVLFQTAHVQLTATDLPVATVPEYLCKGNSWDGFHLQAGSVLACNLNHSWFGR